MLLVIDIGNTNTVFGLFYDKDDEPVFHRRTITRTDRTPDELGVFLKGFLKEGEISPEQIHSSIYSSVVPAFNPIVETMLDNWFHVKAINVNYEIKLPFSIKYPRPFEIGADRLVNAAAVIKHYPGKNIIIDMGTATTFCVVNEKSEYLGGIIAPGLQLSIDSLIKRTAQLPPIVFQPPKQVIGSSTVEALQSGFFFGWVGLLEGIITQIKKVHGVDYRVISTGGLVTVIDKAHKGLFNVIDSLLTLKGLKVLYELNKE
ncbi:MAG: type III pantothenate kinase [Leptospiraceae bacterium]|nr:type III pantothenate kinase [Leptospiraceae bacterium]MCP5493647.1 type III pantothenate kinase [Leptospiraceae bacterium]